MKALLEGKNERETLEVLDTLKQVVLLDDAAPLPPSVKEYSEEAKEAFKLLRHALCARDEIEGRLAG